MLSGNYTSMEIQSDSLSQKQSPDTLASEGLPTNPKELEILINETFAARNEPIDYQDVARDYTRTYGRVLFNPTLEYPNCYQ
mgnify:CR=1 FL=1